MTRSREYVLLRDLQVELGITNQALRARLKRMAAKPILVPKGRYMVSAVMLPVAEAIRRSYWQRHRA